MVSHSASMVKRYEVVVVLNAGRANTEIDKPLKTEPTTKTVGTN